MSTPAASWLDEWPDSFLWPDEREGPYRVRLDWAIVNGVGQIVGIQISSVESFDRSHPPVPVNTSAPHHGPGGLIDWHKSPERHSHPHVEPAFAPINWNVWRQFGFRDVEAKRRDKVDLLRALATWERRTPSAESSQDGTAVERYIRSAQALDRNRGRPNALPDRHYAKVADIITLARRSGRRDVLVAVIEAFDETTEFPKVTWGMANNWRRRAQALGFLPPPRPRRAHQPEDQS